MEVSIFLAKAWGLYLIIMVVALLLNKNSLRRLMKVISDEGFLYTTGFMSLVIGLLSVLAHNVWTFDWRGIVTLLGWMALLKGVTRFAWPDQIIHITNKLKDNTALIHVSFVLMLLVGVYLTYSGYTN